jgi:hypothetical protein
MFDALAAFRDNCRAIAKKKWWTVAPHCRREMSGDNALYGPGDD